MGRVVVVLLLSAASLAFVLYCSHLLLPTARLSVGQRRAEPLPQIETHAACVATLALQERHKCVREDWAAWNAKPATLALIEASGGLTPSMRAFMRTYESAEWSGSGIACGSGRGSHPLFAARTLCHLAYLLPLVLQVDLLIDFPCGDQQWAPLLRERAPGVKYLGVDVMPGLVQRNTERFSAPGRVEFLLGELDAPDVFAALRARSTLWAPGDRVAVLSRHVLEHNTEATAQAFFTNLWASNASYFIGTSVPVASNDPARGLGGYSSINFHVPPYNFNRGMLEWLETPVYSFDDVSTTMVEVWEVPRMVRQMPVSSDAHAIPAWAVEGGEAAKV